MYDINNIIMEEQMKMKIFSKYFNSVFDIRSDGCGNIKVQLNLGTKETELV